MMLPDSGLVKSGIRVLWVFFLILLPRQTLTDEIRVATASNFRTAMTALANEFEVETGHQATVITGSTGKHFAQIIHGAPFDVFFAADRERPEKLESEGLTVPGSRFTYAFGKLILWSPQADYVDVGGRVLKQGNFYHLAVANPQLAPYGRAAREVLENAGLWESLSKRLVRGENVAQAFQFVHSGNAELGFVALSQLKDGDHLSTGSHWPVPPEMYGAIEQQAVVLRDNRAAREFMSFVQSARAARIIRTHGYETPEHDHQ
jgi:molybdate transport system substrate-binding protein